MVAALNHIISKCSDRCMPLLKALKRTKEFVWIDECDKDLKEMKEYLNNPPLISIPEPHEQLYMYLVSSDRDVSSALLREHDNVQKPVYYTNNCLIGPELNYLILEKLVLGLITTSRKLRHYFDAHPIKVLISSPIKAALRKVDISGRMEKWSVELDRFHIEYEPRAAIKGQVLVDFIAEFNGNARVESDNELPTQTGGQCIEMAVAEHPNPVQVQLPPEQHMDVDPSAWTIYIVGSLATNGSGVSIVFRRSCN